MQPEEAANNIRSEANHILQMIYKIQSNEITDMSKEDLTNWLCLALQQHAEFKISVADLIQKIGEAYPSFQLIPVSSQEVYRQNTQQASKNIETPPFDIEFWMGLDDF